jgi:hypothetical protein
VYGDLPVKPLVYIESTVVSYLSARPSRDLVQAAHQEITWEWWEKRRQDFELCVSQLVLREVSAGDENAATRRVDAIRDLAVLDIDEEAVELAVALVTEGLLPEKAMDDALHLGIAAVHGAAYLLTWNCTHLANAAVAEDIRHFIEARGYKAPVVCVPEELLEA